MNFVMWKCHVDDYSKGRYGMILVIYLLVELGLNINFSNFVIEADDAPFMGATARLWLIWLHKYLRI